MKRIKALLLCTAAAGLLSACAGTGTYQSSSASHKDKIQNALMRAAQKNGQSQELIKYEYAYKHDPRNANAALDYARVLRIHGQADKATMILTSFTLGPQTTPDLLGEYAFIQLALGKYKSAQQYAAKGLTIDNDNDSAIAHHALGVALGMQNKHEQAEVHLRAALDNWTGDPVPVLNNLALNLALQGRNKEAINYIHQATALAPQRADIDNNKRIILALNDDHKSKAPKPDLKPIYR